MAGAPRNNENRNLQPRNDRGAEANASPVGRTKDAGWEVGVRSTVAVAIDDVWDYLFEDGLEVWLGDVRLVLEKGAEYETADGIRGVIRSYTPGFRVRLTWRPATWHHDSTLQLTVREAATGTTIAFHQERLSDREERKLMLGHWKDVVSRLEAGLAP